MTENIKKEFKNLIKEIKLLWKIRTFKSYNKHEINKLIKLCKK